MSLDGYDDKIIVDFHFYEPFYFTHQSLPWVLDPLRYIAASAIPGQRVTWRLQKRGHVSISPP